MRMVREQMLCIVTPDWRTGAGGVTQALSLQLDALFRSVEVIRFASLALLPPAPGSPSGALPSLMLELAIDEGYAPADLLTLLAHAPGDALWNLYGQLQHHPDSLTPVQRRQRVLGYLASGLSVADAAFVGARDRTGQQIRDERQLLLAVRAHGRALCANAPALERAALAQEIVRWVQSQPRFDWARQPAPRSYWRDAGASVGGKLRLLGFWVGGVLGLVWLTGMVAKALAWLASAVAKEPVALAAKPSDDHAAWAPVLAVRSVAAGADWLLQTAWPAGAVLLIVGFVWWLLYVALPVLVPAWRRLLDTIDIELNRPTTTWSSRLTYAAGWIVWPMLALVALQAAAFIFSKKEPSELVFGPGLALQPRLSNVLLSWPLLWACAWTLAVFAAGLTAVDWLLARQSAERFKAWLFRPAEDEVPRAQQVHPSIEQCEADLIDGTAHMISLTEVRWPFGWSAGCTRAAMRVVTFAGRVFFTDGRLGDAPGIHFGHWHIIDGGRRMLFVSNFDGSFGGYLDDFIRGANRGTTLFWRWTRLRPRRAAVAGHPDVQQARRFPPTRFLLWRGVRCELAFKAYARDSMLPHLYRWDACNLSVDQIDRATALRDALCGPRTDAADDCIMRAIEA